MSCNNIVIINGSGGCGKSTFTKLCCEQTKGMTVGNKILFVDELSSVDAVKAHAVSMGWDENSKTEKDRQFLHELKKLLTWYNDLPNRSVFAQIRTFSTYEYFDDMEVLPFVNIREPECIEDFVQQAKSKGYNVLTVLVRNPHIPPITSNYADASVEDYCYDYIIENDGTLEDLRLNAQRLLEDIGEVCFSEYEN